MADFCRECSIDRFGKDYGELRDLCQDKTITLSGDEGFPTTCEGCGPTLVDWAGQCISSNCLEKHTPEKIFTTYSEHYLPESSWDEPI